MRNKENNFPIRSLIWRPELHGSRKFRQGDEEGVPNFLVINVFHRGTSLEKQLDTRGQIASRGKGVHTCIWVVSGLPGALCSVCCLGVSSILESETIESTWPIAFTQKKKQGGGAQPQLYNKQNVKRQTHVINCAR